MLKIAFANCNAGHLNVYNPHHNLNALSIPSLHTSSPSPHAFYSPSPFAVPVCLP
ncbi:hypothetical protein BDR03DRAFT_951476 [Suillus americanus]|nr:hypothetical protein BDR03DRAFT_951476 [Suillus americanus]